MTDAVLCVEARKDPENGAKNLLSVTWIAKAVGGIGGGLLGGYFTQYSHPKYLFLMYSSMGLLISYQGSKISEEGRNDEGPDVGLDRADQEREGEM